MRFRFTLLIVFLAISIAALSFGYLTIGCWQIIPAILLFALLCGLLYKSNVQWSANIYFAGYTILAGVGIYERIPNVIVIIGIIAALASWDLLQFNKDISENSLPSAILSLERNHLQSLFLALSLGLILALAVNSLQIRIPFAVIWIFGFFGIASMIFGIQLIDKGTQ